MIKWEFRHGDTEGGKTGRFGKAAGCGRTENIDVLFGVVKMLRIWFSKMTDGQTVESTR